MNADKIDRFVVKAWLGSEQLPFIPCSTDDEAVQVGFELFDKYGRDLHVEIYWNNRPPIRTTANGAILSPTYEG
jgi:hypothetical protein